MKKSLSLTKPVKLSSVPISYITDSSETNDVYYGNEALGLPLKNDDSNRQDKQNKQELVFSRLQGENNVLWSFYFNVENVTAKLINTFIICSSQFKENDTVLIHAPCVIDRTLADALHSAICSAKRSGCNMIISAPYILCTEAAYLLTSADSLIVSPFIHIRFTPPSAFGGGPMLDALGSIGWDIYGYKRIINKLKEEEFLTEDMAKSLNDQSMAWLPIDAAVRAYQNYNKRHNK